MGTYALVQLAHLRGVPCYSLCTAQKFLPAEAAPLIRIVDHPSAEVWPDAPRTLSVRNHYFEMTPLALLRGVVSDQGVYTPAVLAQALHQRTLSPMLWQLASGLQAHGSQAE